MPQAMGQGTVYFDRSVLCEGAQRLSVTRGGTLLPHERASIDLTCIAMLVNRQVLTLAMPHLSQLRAVLLDRSRSVPRCLPSFSALAAGLPHAADAPTQDFFGADSLTSKFSFARSEHGLRDGSGVPQPDTRKRAPILAFCKLTIFTPPRCGVHGPSVRLGTNHQASLGLTSVLGGLSSPLLGRRPTT